MKPKHQLRILFFGPVGCGKSTIIDKIVNHIQPLNLNIVYAVSATAAVITFVFAITLGSFLFGCYLSVIKSDMFGILLLFFGLYKTLSLLHFLIEEYDPPTKNP